MPESRRSVTDAYRSIPGLTAARTKASASRDGGHCCIWSGNGAAEVNRTLDPVLTKDVLYH